MSGIMVIGGALRRLFKKEAFMRTVSFPSIIAFLLFFVSASAAQTRPGDGAIVESKPCAAAPKRTYEQYREDTKKRSEEEVFEANREGVKWDFERDFRGRLMPREEFERRENFTAYDCRKIKYISDGLKVVGFVWKPKGGGDKKFPLVIANRGGNREYGKLTEQSFFYPLVTQGFVVIASQYRGVDGGEGTEEFGGADVNDVLNLIPLARSLEYVDMNNVFLLGASRGAMQSFLAIKKGMSVNAVAVFGGAHDLTAAAKERPELVERVWSKLIPNFREKGEKALRERSAVYFADEINVPVLIIHGGADWRSNAGSQALGLANKLQALGKTYELIIYAGDDHPTTYNRLDRERRTVEWFRRHMR